MIIFENIAANLYLPDISLCIFIKINIIEAHSLGRLWGLSEADDTKQGSKL